MLKLPLKEVLGLLNWYTRNTWLDNLAVEADTWARLVFFNVKCLVGIIDITPAWNIPPAVIVIPFPEPIEIKESVYENAWEVIKDRNNMNMYLITIW